MGDSKTLISVRQEESLLNHNPPVSKVVGYEYGTMIMMSNFDDKEFFVLFLMQLTLTNA